MCDPRTPLTSGCPDRRSLAKLVDPWSGGVDHPGSFDALFHVARPIAHHQPSRSSMRQIDCENLCVVPDRCPGSYSLAQPLGN
jgi:hypothetical protein